MPASPLQGRPPFHCPLDRSRKPSCHIHLRRDKLKRLKYWPKVKKERKWSHESFYFVLPAGHPRLPFFAPMFDLSKLLCFICTWHLNHLTGTEPYQISSYSTNRGNKPYPQKWITATQRAWPAGERGEPLQACWPVSPQDREEVQAR
jgi:hypothetical protein